MFRLENNTPPVYTQESRDFQLFLRTYDSILHSVKFDIDDMQNITNTKEIKTELLPLLQTKLGFFTEYNINRKMMRAILEGFPTLIKNKGSIAGIRQAVTLFLKALNVRTSLDIDYTESGVTVKGIDVGDHSIIIGIEEAIDNFYILEELFKYILPVGFGYTIIFYKDYENKFSVSVDESIQATIVGQDINSSMRYMISPGNVPKYVSSKVYHFGDIVTNSTQDKLYRCKVAQTNKRLNSNDWEDVEWEDVTSSLQDENYNYKYNTLDPRTAIRNALINAGDTIMIYSTYEDGVEKYNAGDRTMLTDTVSFEDLEDE